MTHPDLAGKNARFVRLKVSAEFYATIDKASSSDKSPKATKIDPSGALLEFTSARLKSSSADTRRSLRLGLRISTK